MADMNATDYLVNGLFVLVVLRQARERRLDARSILVPLAVVVLVAQNYLHVFPTRGNDLLFIGALATLGLALGTLCGFATHVRAGDDGVALARVGWVAGALLVFGISARMVFAFAVGHGFQPAVAGFSATHSIDAAAWPVALVLMAVCEVAARLVIVQVRGRIAVSAAAQMSGRLGLAA